MKHDQLNFFYENFLFVYMYELEKALMNSVEEMKSIPFHSDEANTDKPLKEFLKAFIENKLNRLSLQMLKKTLIINQDDSCSEISCAVFNKVYIKHVFLQNEITDGLKQSIKNSKTSIYTNPDLLLELTDGNTSKFISIEVKSTTRDSIPGSSIQQINKNEWVIFVKHKKNKIEIITGKYINSINNILRFPDRSPRPEVSFNEVKTWNESYRSGSLNHICYTIKKEAIKEKQLLLEDWQNYLADKWIQVVFQEEMKKNEPWFNETLRKFICKFIGKFEQFNPSEKESYIKFLKNNITNKS